MTEVIENGKKLFLKFCIEYEILFCYTGFTGSNPTASRAYGGCRKKSVRRKDFSL